MKPIEPVYRLFGARVEQLRTLLGWNQPLRTAIDAAMNNPTKEP